MTNGYFFDTTTWSINTEGKGRSIHWTLALLISPIAGLLLLMFLPLIGFYLLSQVLILKVWSLIDPMFRPANISVGEAHILGGPGSSGPHGSDGALEELAKEIGQKRG